MNIASNLAKEISYSVLARYFPKKYTKQDIEREVRDRSLITKYLKSLSLTSIKFETALVTFLDLVRNMIPKFTGSSLTDLSGLVSTRLDTLSQMIEDFLADFAPGQAVGTTGSTETTTPAPTGKGWKTGALMGGAALGGAALLASPASGSTGNQATSMPTQHASATQYTSTAPGEVKGILDYIADSEGTDYNTQFGYQNTTGGVPLTDLTIGQIMEAQKAQKGSSAIGRYQFMKATLPEAMVGAGLTTSDMFSVENQDKMAMFLLKRRGYDKWKAGGMTNRDFGRKLSQEWASIPDPYTGASYYGQNVKHGTDVLMQVLQQAGSKMEAGEAKDETPKLYEGAVTDGKSTVEVGDNKSGKEFIIPDSKLGMITDLIEPSFTHKAARLRTEVQPIIIYQD